MNEIRENIIKIVIVSFSIGFLLGNALSLILLLVIFKITGGVTHLEVISVIALYMIVFNWAAKGGVRNILKYWNTIINEIKEIKNE